MALAAAPSWGGSTDPFAALTGGAVSAGPGSWAILALGQYGVAANNTAVILSAPPPKGDVTHVDNNIGVSAGGSYDQSGLTQVNGIVYLDYGVSYGQGSQVTPPLNPGIDNPRYLSASDTMLKDAAASAMAAYAAATLYTNPATAPAGANFVSVPVCPSGPCNINTSAINPPLTLTGVSGLNVINLNDLTLSNGVNLTLDAPADAKFLVNITGNFTSSGNPYDEYGIALTGGLSASNVLYNIIGGDTSSAQAVNFTGHIASVPGIILAPYRDIILGPGIVTGELIGGGNQIFIKSAGSEVELVPEPGSLLLLGSGLLALARWRRRT